MVALGVVIRILCQITLLLCQLGIQLLFHADELCSLRLQIVHGVDACACCVQSLALPPVKHDGGAVIVKSMLTESSLLCLLSSSSCCKDCMVCWFSLTRASSF